MRPRDAIGRAAPWVGAVLLFAALAVWLLDFRLEYAGSRLPGGLGDPVLNLYFMEWGGRSIAQGLRGFWDANFFFPATGVMTLSDHMLGPAAQAMVFRLFWDNGVAAYNLLFVSSFVVSGLATAWVLRASGASAWAAVLAGIMFAFSPYRFGQESHLQVLLMQWIPLTLWYWDRLLARPGFRHAALFTAFYLLHVTGGNYLAYFLHFALAILLLQHVREWRRLLSRRSLRALAPALAICGAVAAALFYPYLAVHRTFGLERGASEIAFYGATIKSYLAIEAGNELWGGTLLRRIGRPENRLFAGFVTTILAVAGLVRLGRRRFRSSSGEPRHDGQSTWTRGILWSGLFFFLLSFSAVFARLARMLPGLSSMRVPTRGYAFVSLALVVLAAAGVEGLLRRAPRRRLLIAFAIGLLLCVELRSRLAWHPFPRDSSELAIFSEIARHPEVQAVLHLPMLGDAREAHYMYYSTLHWKPIANGYSGFEPGTHVELERRMRDHPMEDETIDYLLDLGITHVGAHPLLLRAPRGRRQLARWERHFGREPEPRIRLVAAAGKDRLYELLPRSSPPAAATGQLPGPVRMGR